MTFLGILCGALVFVICPLLALGCFLAAFALMAIRAETRAINRWRDQ